MRTLGKLPSRHRITRLLAALCLSSVAGVVTLPAHAQDYQLKDVVPARLVYGASKFLISVETEVTQNVMSAEAAKTDLLAAGRDEGLAASEEGVFKINLSSSILGTRSSFDAWLNPDGAILQRTSLYTGHKDWYRNFRYFEGGAYSIKRKPHNSQEEGRPWSEWSEVNEDRYIVSEKAAGVTLSEAEAIFYLVNVANLKKPGDVAVQHLFDTDGTITVTMTVADIVPLEVDFKEFTTNGERHVEETLDAVHIRIACAPFDPTANTENFKFLGYKGDIDFYIDPVRRVMIRATGKIDYIGTVEINLKEADFRS